MKIPKILAVFLNGPIISENEMSHHAAPYDRESPDRRATSGAFCYLRQIVSRRLFNRVLIIGSAEREPFDLQWINQKNLPALCGMKSADIRFYRSEAIDDSLRRIAVTHAIHTDERMATNLPSIGMLYIMSEKRTPKMSPCGQTVQQIENGWAGIAKLLL